MVFAGPQEDGANGLQHAKEIMQEELQAAKQEMRNTWEADLRHALLASPVKGATYYRSLAYLSVLPTKQVLLTRPRRDCG